MSTAARLPIMSAAHLARQRAWSFKTFGPPRALAGVLDHIAKEIEEIAANPADLSEYIDVIILAADGAFCAGFTPDEVIHAWQADDTPALQMPGPNALRIIRAFAIERGREDIRPWVALMRTAADYAMAQGYTAEQIGAAWIAKQDVNEARTWPDWRTADPSKAIEHMRTPEETTAKEAGLHAWDVSGVPV